MKALILAAGEGTRLRPLTENCPKPMLPVAGRPLLAHTVEHLVRQGFDEIAINLHHRPEAVREYFGDGSAFGAKITWSHEAQLLGTAGAARKLRAFLDRTFVVVYGDVLTDMDVRGLVGFHRAHDAALTLSLYRVTNPTEVGLVGTDAEGRVTRFVEKPAANDVFTDTANAGVLVCEPSVLDGIPDGAFADFGHDVLPALLEAGKPVYGVPMSDDEYLIDIGTPEKYLEAQTAWRTREERAARPAGDPVDGYLKRLEAVIRNLSRDAVWDVINVLMRAWHQRKTVFLMGNGGSAATASHMANDLNKLTLLPGLPRFRALALTDNVPLMTAWGNDASYDQIFAQQMLSFLQPGDIVIGISTSGNSPNVVEALRVAKENKAVTVAFTGRRGGKLAGMVDHLVAVPSDHIGRQEDAHMVLDHVIANVMRQLAETRWHEFAQVSVTTRYS